MLNKLPGSDTKYKRVQNRLHDDRNKSTQQGFEEGPLTLHRLTISSTNNHDHNDGTKKRFVVISSIVRLFRISPEPTHNR
jgi:hypothetical protein